eukprot:g2783.t1
MFGNLSSISPDGLDSLYSDKKDEKDETEDSKMDHVGLISRLDTSESLGETILMNEEEMHEYLKQWKLAISKKTFDITDIANFTTEMLRSWWKKKKCTSSKSGAPPEIPEELLSTLREGVLLQVDARQMDDANMDFMLWYEYFSQEIRCHGKTKERIKTKTSKVTSRQPLRPVHFSRRGEGGLADWGAVAVLLTIGKCK